MKKYVVITKKGGYVFYICHNEKKGFFVSSDAPDHDVLTIDNIEDAENLAKSNSNDNTKYEVRLVTF